MKRSQILVLGWLLVLAGGSVSAAGSASSTRPVFQSVYTWLDQSLRHLDFWARYELRSRPGALAAYWLTERVNGLLDVFSPGTSGPMVGTANSGVLEVMPVVGVESSGYGYRRHPISRRRKFHKGVDFQAPRGTPVYAAGPGVVEVARRKGSYGRLVIISHGLGLETRYAHLRRIKVREGAYVEAGALIGTVGSTGRTTGPHLHFEVRQSGEAVNPHWALGSREPAATVGSDLVEDIETMLSWLAPAP